jgi:hypothetical protein
MEQRVVQATEYEYESKTLFPKRVNDKLQIAKYRADAQTLSSIKNKGGKVHGKPPLAKKESSESKNPTHRRRTARIGQVSRQTMLTTHKELPHGSGLIWEYVPMQTLFSLHLNISSLRFRNLFKEYASPISVDHHFSTSQPKDDVRSKRFPGMNDKDCAHFLALHRYCLSKNARPEEVHVLCRKEKDGFVNEDVICLHDVRTKPEHQHRVVQNTLFFEESGRHAMDYLESILNKHINLYFKSTQMECHELTLKEDSALDVSWYLAKCLKENDTSDNTTYKDTATSITDNKKQVGDNQSITEFDEPTDSPDATTRLDQLCNKKVAQKDDGTESVCSTLEEQSGLTSWKEGYNIDEELTVPRMPLYASVISSFGDAYNQQLHVDESASFDYALKLMKETELNEEGKEVPVLHHRPYKVGYILFLPLSEEGMAIRALIPCKDYKTLTLKNLKIPFGAALLLRADIFHGGCYGNVGNTRFQALLSVDDIDYSQSSIKYLSRGEIKKL